MYASGSANQHNFKQTYLCYIIVSFNLCAGCSLSAHCSRYAYEYDYLDHQISRYLIEGEKFEARRLVQAQTSSFKKHLVSTRLVTLECGVRWHVDMKAKYANMLAWSNVSKISTNSGGGRGHFLCPSLHAGVREGLNEVRGYVIQCSEFPSVTAFVMWLENRCPLEMIPRYFRNIL
jgi:hypothetical protein